MQRFTDAVRDAIRQQNWYSALAVALLLPDMCVAVEIGKKGNRHQYAAWFDAWVAHRYVFEFAYRNEEEATNYDVYIKKLKDEGRIIEFLKLPRNYIVRTQQLSGLDCYCLRCALIHEASDDISSQHIRDTLDKFIFRYPDGTRVTHRNSMNGLDRPSILQLQVDIFCEDLCQGVEFWAQNAKNNGSKLNVNNLIEILPASADL